MEVIQERYKDTKIGRIPKDWEVKKLNEFTNYDSSNLSLNKLEENTGKYKLYGASGLLKTVDFFQSENKYFAIVKDGSGFGNLIWCDEYSSILGTLGRLTNNELSDLKFCYYLTHTIKFKKYMSGSTIPHLYYKDYGNVKLAFPPLPEQQKIAEILSTVDEQISITQAIIDKSKELKKGLMQKLFSEGIGHTEFKDTKIGRIPKDWEVVKIGEVTKIKVGRDLKEDAFSTVKTETHKYPVFSNTVSDNGFYGGYYNFAEHEGNSLTIVGRGVGIGTSFSRKGGYGAIGRLLVLFPNDGINEVFMSYFVNHKMTIHYEDGGIPQLTGDKISKYKVAKPQLIEQQKIAEILSEADSKIEKEESEKAKLEELKKGLMQQLLTGKKRVKV